VVFKGVRGGRVVFAIGLIGEGLIFSPTGAFLFFLTWIFCELALRDREDGCATGQPQGVGSEAYLNTTSQGPTPEGARKDGHIIRARCAPLSPASGFPVSRSEWAIHEISGSSRLSGP